MNEQNLVSLISALAWPVTALTLGLVFRSRLAHLLYALTQRLEAGSELTTPWISVGAVIKLPLPSKEGKVTEAHIALVHSCWRYPKKDREFKQRMYCFHAVIQGADQVLDRIDSVTYHLDPSYPNAKQVIAERASKFKLKELANGESMLKAVVSIKGQTETIELARYINLTESGPAI